MKTTPPSAAFIALGVFGLVILLLLLAMILGWYPSGEIAQQPVTPGG